MPIIASNSLNSPVPVTLTQTTLTASDTLTYNEASSQTLFLQNSTGSPVTVTVDGAGAPTAFAPGGIGKTLDLSAGLPIVVPANGAVAVQLRNIKRYLAGVIAVTGGVGVTAWIVE